MEDENQQQPTTSLSVQFTSQAVETQKAQRAELRKFVMSQLREGVDFGLIPGTQKASLWQPGAQKLMSLFQLGSRVLKSEKVLDLKMNFAMYSATIEIFHLPSGKSVSQCEGVCNSHEKKYRMRAVYEGRGGQRRKVGEEETPVGDLLNTL